VTRWKRSPSSGGGLLVRVQQLSPWPYASKLAFVRQLSDTLLDLRFQRVTEDSVVFGPSTPDDAMGTEDPYAVFREMDGTYYMFYTAVADKDGQWFNATLSLATNSGDPANASAWVKRGAVLPSHPWMGKTCCGGLLLRDDGGEEGPLHYLFFGEGEVLVATTRTPADATSYELQPSPLLTTRKGYFDSSGVEGGSAPLRLQNGDYFYIYDAHSPWAGVRDEYHPGYVVLNGSNPTQVLFRASVPLMLPTEPTEVDGLTRHCIFGNSVVQVPDKPNAFAFFYGEADTAVGAAIVTVSWPQ